VRQRVEINVITLRYVRERERERETMPAVLGTMFSLDDLVSPMIVSGVANVMFMMFGELRCSEGDYTIKMLILVGLTMQTILQFAIAYASCRLTLMEYKRDFMSERLLKVYIIVSCFVFVFGLGYVFKGCSGNALSDIVLYVLWFNTCSHLLAAFPKKVYFCVMDKFSRIIRVPLFWIWNFRDTDMAVLDLVSRQWSEFLRPLRDGEKTDLMLLTPSDFLAALIVLGQTQLSRIRQKENSNKTQRRLHCDDDDDDDDDTARVFLKDASYYVKYALATYGFLLDTYMTLLSPSRIARYFLRNDFSCTNIAALLRQLDGRIKKQDLVHVSFENDGMRKPWFVAIDRTRRSVILSIRGSLSAVDVVTDLAFMDPNKISGSESLEPYAKEFDLCEDITRNGTVHYGILCSALSIAREIRDRNILRDAFRRVSEDDDNEDECAILLNNSSEGKDEEEKGSFDLVILGHSLGAGLATVVSIFLRSSYPGLECIAYVVSLSLSFSLTLLYIHTYIHTQHKYIDIHLLAVSCQQVLPSTQKHLFDQLLLVTTLCLVFR